MKRPIHTRIAMLAVLALAASFALPALAQSAAESSEVLISLYRIAPGKHLDFLKWQAAREKLAADAGIPVGQWYMHLNGDSWDFVSVSPITTAEQDAKLDELARAAGLTTGMKAGLEFRTLVASHTDTFSRGPMTATQLVDAASR